MAAKIDAMDIEVLMKASDYRNFISALIVQRNKYHRFGYSDIARTGGFKARSFPRDVALGKKRITLKSLPKFIKGLGLTSDLAEYFKILVEIEEVDCRVKNLNMAKLQNLKETLQKRISSKKAIRLDIDQDLNFIYSSIPKIYASLGPHEIGATVDDILDKTSLPETEVLRSLKFMIERKLIHRSKARYFPKELHLNFQNLESEVFRNHFVKTAEESILMSKKHIQSNEKLFLSSAFSVSQKDLPKLKEDLRAVILRYIDQAENPHGDRVINLTTSLY